MAVHFIAGRSGSGKTYHCLKAIRDELLCCAEGCPLILLVPEQATFQMEQSLLSDADALTVSRKGNVKGNNVTYVHKLSGYHRARVLSFERLAQELTAQNMGHTLPVLSNIARQMVLRRLLQENQNKLTIFRQAALHSGFIVKLASMISELRQYRQSPEQLVQKQNELLKNQLRNQYSLAAKLGDLAIIFGAYQDYIRGRFIDPDDFLDMIVPLCAKADFLRGAYLWIDGFADFTPQQFNVLLALFSAAQDSWVSLCLDPQDPAFERIITDPYSELPDATSLFYPTLKLAQRLVKLLNKSNLAVGQVLSLPDSDTDVMPRFVYSPGLSQLERYLFANMQPNHIKNNRNQAKTRQDNWENSIKDKRSDNTKNRWEDNQRGNRDVMLVSANNRRTEATAVARQIMYLVRKKGYRFRDIAVILRDFGDYQDLLEAAFSEHDIPYFIDQPRLVRHHPLVEMLQMALLVITSDFKSEHVIDYLKTDLAGLSRLQSDTLENYVLAHDIQHSRWYDNKAWYKDTQTDSDCNIIDKYRRKAVNPLLQLRNDIYVNNNATLNASEQNETATTTTAAIMAGDTTGNTAPIANNPLVSVTTVTAALVKLMANLAVGDTLASWYNHAVQSGDMDKAQQHEQIYADILAMFDDMVRALGNIRLSLDDYIDILQSAMEQMSLRLIPPVLDQVLIGSIERSRHPQIKAAFVMGLNEGSFPRLAAPDMFFTDRQRQQLIESGFELAPSRTERLLQERYLGYIALTRAQEFLWISYAASDNGGGVLHPSVFMDDIKLVLSDIDITSIETDFSQPDPRKIYTPTQLAGQLTLAMAQIRDNMAAGNKKTAISDNPYMKINDAAERETNIGGLWNIHQWLELYRYTRNIPQWSTIVDRCVAGVTYTNLARLLPDITQCLFADNITVSASQLECYASCPFQYYARFILHLKPRQQLQLSLPDMGMFYHAVLSGMFHKMQQQHTIWQKLDDTRLDNMLRQVIDELLSTDTSLAELQQQSYRNRYLLDDATYRLRSLCRTIRAVAQAGQFTQVAAELAFGMTGTRATAGAAIEPEPGPERPKHSDLPNSKFDITIPAILPAVTIALPDNNLLLRGKIDRVDICIRSDGICGISITDYKSSSRSFDFTGLYHGLSLQLSSYMLALYDNLSCTCHHTRNSYLHNTDGYSSLSPAAMLYFPLKPISKSQGFLPVDYNYQGDYNLQQIDNHANDTNSIPELPLKAEGLMNSQWVDYLDGTILPTAWSRYYKLYRKKDGSFSKTRSPGIIKPTDMANILAYTRYKISQLARMMLNGNIDVAPSRIKKNSPCSYCDYKPLCRFDFSRDRYRILPDYDKDEVLKKISELISAHS